jgi:hypothetical protein
VKFGIALSLAKVEGPGQRLEFLGIVIDTVLETLSISEERRADLERLLGDFHKRRTSSKRKLQSLLGVLSFASTVLPGARPFLRRIIDLTKGRGKGVVKLGEAFRSEVRYWATHLRSWNGRCRWRVDVSSPMVFASDASTSGFAYGLESCSSADRAGLEPAFAPGMIRAGVWSAARGDAARQQHSSAIQWGEFYCPLAAAVEYGERLRDRHVVFVVDNASDVAVLNRQRTRDPRVAELLRALCDKALEFNFSFAAVHRYGVDNVLMDWASRPALHKFEAMPRRQGLANSAVAGGGGGGGVCRFPPLLHPTSVSFINSRCLNFGGEGNSASWAEDCSGWSASPCA